MKKFIKKIVLFALFSLLFFLIVLFIWGSYLPDAFKPNMNYRIGSYGHTFSRLKEVEQVKEVNVLFVGSSHAYRGFDTRIFENQGIRSFNLGSGSQTPLQTKLLLDRYLDQLNPQILVYEVYPATFDLDGVESSLDIIANIELHSDAIKMAFKINHLKVYQTLLYGMMRELFNLNDGFYESIQKDHDTYIKGGFVEKELQYYQPNEQYQETWNFRSDQLEEFDEILKMMEQRNIKVILVYAPITSGLYKSYTNHQEFDSLMSERAEYYNFNGVLQLQDTLHFYDSHHLNQKGVEIFNQKLIQIIKQDHLN